MNDFNIIENIEPPSIEPYLIECKFTIESKGTLGEAVSNKRITFEGYATDELYGAVMNAVMKVVGE